MNVQLKRGHFSSREAAAILKTITDQLVEGGCPDATFEFHFSGFGRKKSGHGVFVRRENDQSLEVAVAYTGNKAALGSLVPVRNGCDPISLQDLKKYLETKTQTSPSEESATSVSEPVSEELVLQAGFTEISDAKPYTRIEILNEAFASLFKDLLPVLFKESKKETLSARDIATLANASRENFFEDGRCINALSIGHLLARLCKENVLSLANSGRPFALYKISVQQPLTEVKTDPVGLAEINPDDIQKLVLNKSRIEEGLTQIGKDLIDANKELRDVQARIAGLEDRQRELLKSQEESEKGLERYRQLYTLLGRVFV